MTRILKKHVGRTVDFVANPEWKPINGVIQSVRHGIATVTYWVAERIDDSRRIHNAEGWRALIESRHVVEIY